MFRQPLMWAFLCATAPAVCSQTSACDNPTPCDTTEYTINSQYLDEITVTVQPVINKSDRKIIRPGKETILISANGIDLLRRLQLPFISVNPMTNAVTASGGGNVVLCINGVEATAAQISATDPKDIVRIEYHDNPGVRYAGAAAVIDYITTRHDDGGFLSFDSFGAYAKGRWATLDHIAGQYNRGRSAWSVNAGYMGQQKDGWLRDYDETWLYPDATVTRREHGLPVTVGQSGFEGSVSYNYRHPSGNILDARLGFNLSDVPDKEEGDRKAILTSSDTGTPLMVREHTEEHAASPGINLYYLHRLSDRSNIIVEAQGSWMRSRMLHEYSENNITETGRVTGNKYSMKLLAMYENRCGSRVWNIGVAGSGSAIRNTYHQETPVKISIGRGDYNLSGEYSDRFGIFTATGSARMALRHMEQAGKSFDKAYLLPAASIACRPSERLFMRYAASLDYTMPSAAESSAVEQPIQTDMVRRGNPELRPFRVIVQSFDAAFSAGPLSVDARVEYRHENKPVMESVIFENGRFVRTYFNQRSFQRLRVEGALSLQPWKNHLTITAQPGFSRYFSHGLDYRHCHNIFRLGLSVDFSYSNWLAYANIFSGPANSMYGEEIIEEKDMNQIMAGYKRGAWSLHIGVFNAFLKNYWMETRNLSALAPYTSKAHSARSSSYLAIRFSLSLDFGRGMRNTGQHESASDNDSGILSGTK